MKPGTVLHECGQPVPADSQPWQRCLACGKPIKIKRAPDATRDS